MYLGSAVVVIVVVGGGDVSGERRGQETFSLDEKMLIALLFITFFFFLSLHSSRYFSQIAFSLCRVPEEDKWFRSEAREQMTHLGR